MGETDAAAEGADATDPTARPRRKRRAPTLRDRLKDAIS
jgi:hypothetical protein